MVLLSVFRFFAEDFYVPLSTGSFVVVVVSVIAAPLSCPTVPALESRG